MTYPYQLIRDADARTTARLIVPKIQSVPLLLWANGGDSSAQLTRRNLADRTLMGVEGVPAVDPGYVRTTGDANYFRSDVMEPATFTWFAFGRRSDTSADNAHIGVFGGSFLGVVDPGCLFYFSTSTLIRAQAYQGAGTNVLTTLTVSGSNLFKRYRVECVREGGVGTITVFNDTDGTSDLTPGIFSEAPDVGGLPICIGASQSNSFTGHIEWNHQSIFGGIPTSDEVDAHWTQVLAIAADMGVSENT